MFVFFVALVGIAGFFVGCLITWSSMRRDYFLGFEDGLQNARKIYGYKKPERMIETDG